MSEKGLDAMKAEGSCQHGHPKTACEYCKTTSLLRNAESLQEMQRIANRLFPENQRREKIAAAPKDVRGLPVRYYRYMELDKFLILLEKGRQKREDYDKQAMQKDPHEAIWHVCLELLRHRAAAREIECDNFSSKYSTLEELVSAAFPLVTAEILEAVQSRDLGRIRDIMTKNIPKNLQHTIYSSGLAREFTPLIGMSVGGPIREHINRKVNYSAFGLPEPTGPLNPLIYIEAVIPTERVEFRREDAMYCEGEKEVFVEELKMDDITAVAIDDDEYRQRFVDAPDSNIRIFLDYSPRPSMARENDFERWRWETKITDYLPVDRSA